MEDFVKKTHIETLSRHGLAEMFIKFIQELFEVKLVLACEYIDVTKLTEELADCFNMIDKLELSGLRFDFASYKSLDQTIDALVKSLRDTSYFNRSNKLEVAPKQMLKAIAIEFSITEFEIQEWKNKKMLRTAERYGIVV